MSEGLASHPTFHCGGTPVWACDTWNQGKGHKFISVFVFVYMSLNFSHCVKTGKYVKWWNIKNDEND